MSSTDPRPDLRTDETTDTATGDVTPDDATTDGAVAGATAADVTAAHDPAARDAGTVDAAADDAAATAPPDPTIGDRVALAARLGGGGDEPRDADPQETRALDVQETQVLDVQDTQVLDAAETQALPSAPSADDRGDGEHDPLDLFGARAAAEPSTPVFSAASTGTSTTGAAPRATATTASDVASSSAPGAAATPAPPEEAPRGIRVGTVVWGLVVAAVGVGLLAWASGVVFDVELALIGLVAAAGVALLVGSLLAPRRRRR